MKNKKTIGIIGGMGPLATCDLFKKIIDNTPAQKDQDHFHVLVDNNTNIPDRTKALIENGPDPVPEMTAAAKRLEAAGADVLIMPCNTAHGFYDAVSASVDIPLLHMIRITRDALKARGIDKVGLLATSGTIQTGIYKNNFDDIEILIPSDSDQKEVMGIIYDGVKAGVKDYDASKVQKIAEDLISKGAKTIILGCTELPLAMEMYKLNFPSTDPTLELALAAIKYAGGKE